MDEQLSDALAAKARGVVDVVITLAIVRNEKWADALGAFVPAYERAMQDKLAQLEQRRAKRTG